MGCDIHIFCEAKHDLNNGAEPKWYSADRYKYNWFYEKYPDGGENLWEVDPIYKEKFYGLFGLLAGVRDTSIRPISEPRGLPDDLSKVVEDEIIRGDGYYHTFSWYTLGELIAWRNANDIFGVNISDEQKNALDILGIDYMDWLKFRNTNVNDEYFESIIPALDTLITKAAIRACEEFDIYDFFSYDTKKTKLLKVSDQFRIVFCFNG